ncbi:hypothetical protein [Cyanobium sp. ATX-6F1]|uniref:hypothetical protein n=1 Tax=Cyanobium sp. ATX-6F1 TaxID=3137388 RepID=UPI0039BE2145
MRYLPAGGDVGDELRQPSAEARCQRQFAQGRRVAIQLQVLAQRGWHPEVVVGHPFWGDLLFLDDVFPGVPLVALMEMDLLGVPSLDGAPGPPAQACCSGPPSRPPGAWPPASRPRASSCAPSPPGSSRASP